MKKEQLLKLIEELPEDAYVVLEEVSFDGAPNYSRIDKIEYEEYNGVFIIKGR